ncbi:MAG: hypothetical protein NTZ63_02075 [Candidatus Omnitrophica bacterium]|nr:hypothetical protein [Candidatus Omnitrophota bacterium]
MNIRVKRVLPFLILVMFFTLGLSPRPRAIDNLQTQEILIRSIVEEFFQRIESAYAFEDLGGLMFLLDNNFDERNRFKLVLDEYLKSVSYPHIHFVIDMVVSDKDRLSVTVHWYKNATTTSGVEIRMRGLTQLVLVRRPEGLKIIRIKRENPFF